MLGALKNHILGAGLKSSGLGSLLKNQSSHFSSLLGGGSAAGGGSSHAGGGSAGGSGGGGMKWIPIAILVLAGIFIWPILRSCTSSAVDKAGEAANKTLEVAGDMKDKTTNMVGDIADKTTEMVEGATDVVTDVAAKGADFFKFEQGTVAADFADFLSGGDVSGEKTFVLDKVEFDTGSSALRESSQEQLQRIAKIVTAYEGCLLYTSPSPRDQRGSRMPSSA